MLHPIVFTEQQIREKKEDLAELYGSGQADKSVINRKVEELNNMEQQLDEMMSGTPDKQKPLENTKHHH